MHRRRTLLTTRARPSRRHQTPLLGLLLLACQSNPTGAPPARTPAAAVATGVAPAPNEVVAPPNQLHFSEQPVTVLPGEWGVEFARPCVKSTDDGSHVLLLQGEFAVPGFELYLRYDGYLARPVAQAAPSSAGAREVRLATLMDEWGELRPGKHRVVLFAAGTVDGRTPYTLQGEPALSLCDLQVQADTVVDTEASPERQTDPTHAAAAQTRPLDAAAQPRVLLTSPQGTLNGNLAADAALLQLFVIPRARTATLVVERPDGGQDRHQLEAGAYSIAGLTNGDYRFSTGFVAADGFASGGLWTPHVVTVNRDAP